MGAGRELPRDLSRRTASAGLLGVGFPQEVGGDGGDAADVAIIWRNCTSPVSPAGCSPTVHRGDRGAAHDRLRRCPADRRRSSSLPLRGELIGSLAITEPGGGSDVGHLRTTAVRDGDSYVVNGSKTYITSAVRGDYVVAAVRTGGPAPPECPCSSSKGTPGIRGAESCRRWAGAPRTPPSCRSPMRVPAENLVGPENSGFLQIARLRLRTHRPSPCRRTRVRSAAWTSPCSGAGTETFGKPLISRQTVQNTLAEMARRVDVARVYSRNVVERQLEGDQNLIAAVCFAKNTAVEAGEWVASQAVQLFGGMGTWLSARSSASTATCGFSVSAAGPPRS